MILLASSRSIKPSNLLQYFNKYILLREQDYENFRIQLID
ncbi:hypothetical protein FLACOL7796_04544 [Flavobacterium collinsii]|uniref:Uncharacterized protein n=1 Tax=Flavobacterium collinsii TaxID=1114861 RepID=A0ABM8KPS2_9FLAO|nr:hypothetical protein FLACOL7796_04544 [Flavobacterium collinsii]